MDTLDMVKTFAKAFKRPVKETPHIDDDNTNALCVRLIAEELEELTEALEKRDLVEVVDALTDIQYVLDFAYLMLGVHKMKEDAFLAVQDSNMSKLGEDGEPILDEGGKIQKGPNYQKVDLVPVIKRHTEAF